MRGRRLTFAMEAIGGVRAGGSSPAGFVDPGAQRSDIADAQRQGVERQGVVYWCAAGHSYCVTFAADASVPATWECRCGLPAGQDPDHPPVVAEPAVYRTPLEYLHERRSDADLDTILDEALQAVAAARRRDPTGRQ
ncbi:RNA polymerase-binding protein RbpA [Pseudonocardia parietis]|uniref:RNA polymerase-binding protein RbpA n=1 Tax=Pseudonocardia parietis TaxID=570936 RepID=A0ABS4VWX5_9PSEU|nr:RNA polymerase-binding protein RbpA [Pseudonocardia parietis]MBP2368440.1 hypothetical protein [Pseudonocardia parietis]